MASARSSCKDLLERISPGWKLKMWKHSFRARLALKKEVEDVKSKLSCETSFIKWKLKMWKRSFRARCPSKSEKLTVWKRSFRARLTSNFESPSSEIRFLSKTPAFRASANYQTRIRARLPSKSESGRCEGTKLSRDVPQWKLKMWKQSFLARRPSKSELKMWKRSFWCEISLKTENWRIDNEAFVRDFPQKLKFEDVTTKLRARLLLKNWKLKTR